MKSYLTRSFTTLVLSFSICGVFLPIKGPCQDQCTVALIAGSATQDGRPLLVKSRDVSNDDQEFVYDSNGLFPYVSVTYAGVIDQAWGGVNEVGFAIQNANAWNFSDPVPGEDDDGYIIRLALQTCTTVEDFQAIMDSTDVGRTLPAIYGVIDANGDGAFFECAAYEHYRFDLDNPVAAPDGYMVRANFAYEGGSYHLGQHRHDRMLAFLDTAYTGDYITQQYIFQTIFRDLVNEETNPYPLPFQGQERELPYGLLHTHDAINRDITRSAYVVQGIFPTEDPLLCTVWAMAGEPIATVALPLWVHAGSTPVEFDGPEYSAINVRSQEQRDYLYDWDVGSDVIDTWRVIDDAGQGLLPNLLIIENQAAASADSALEIWRNQGIPVAGTVEDFQNSIATWALSEMDAWGPPQTPEVAIIPQSVNEIQLDWQPVQEDVFGRTLTVTQYTIYASDQPFYNRLHGDSITTVSTPPVNLTSLENQRFFQVRCQP
ncbi:hypothetical protein CEE37_04625 [candidate division LCP-89 bacterium B3_LCP]|uniref:Peptidase C45 hydrolase domain-containing protein n=1 Tax=candidate division LCP-89 bacterium B3_LCP TaxID=2012998 RepID=A0A532V4D2_UNCL8|nr:MAG: hypothetical protein CEE37_04625 [candidate division LCP-89 bacterium B3_LCP]